MQNKFEKNDGNSIWIMEGEWTKKEPTTEVVHGSDKVVERFVYNLRTMRERRIDVCVDNTRPLLL